MPDSGIATIELLESAEQDPDPIPAALRSELEAVRAVAMLHDPKLQQWLRCPSVALRGAGGGGLVGLVAPSPR